MDVCAAFFCLKLTPQNALAVHFFCASLNYDALHETTARFIDVSLVLRGLLGVL